VNTEHFINSSNGLSNVFAATPAARAPQAALSLGFLRRKTEELEGLKAERGALSLVLFMIDIMSPIIRRSQI